jgi:hypothetical protein
MFWDHCAKRIKRNQAHGPTGAQPCLYSRPSQSASRRKTSPVVADILLGNMRLNPVDHRWRSKHCQRTHAAIQLPRIEAFQRVDGF